MGLKSLPPLKWNSSIERKIGEYLETKENMKNNDGQQIGGYQR